MLTCGIGFHSYPQQTGAGGYVSIHTFKIFNINILAIIMNYQTIDYQSSHIKYSS